MLARGVLRPLIKPPTSNMRNHWLQLLQREFVDQYFNLDSDKKMPSNHKKSSSHREEQYQDLLSAQQTSRVSDFTGHPGIQRRFPLADIGLLEFCLAAPVHLKFKDGYNRYLIRGGLTGILPSKIQWRTSKEPFSPDYHLRYNRQKSIARNFIQAIKPNDPVREVVNVDNLEQLIQSDMVGSYGNTLANSAGLHLVPSGIYLITFLRQFSEFRL